MIVGNVDDFVPVVVVVDVAVVVVVVGFPVVGGVGCCYYCC